MENNTTTTTINVRIVGATMIHKNRTSSFRIKPPFVQITAVAKYRLGIILIRKPMIHNRNPLHQIHTCVPPCQRASPALTTQPISCHCLRHARCACPSPAGPESYPSLQCAAEYHMQRRNAVIQWRMCTKHMNKVRPNQRGKTLTRGEKIYGVLNWFF